jgi:hypothetical protein
MGALLVWGFHLVFLSGWIGLLAAGQPAHAFYALLLRTLGEQAFLKGFYEPRQTQNHAGEHFALQMPYSFYVVSMGLAVLFSREMVWKDRKFPA